MGSITLPCILQGGHDKVCSLLIQHGALVDIFDGFNNTPLHISAEGGHDKVCSLLIQHGALVDSVDRNNSTPLHYAADGGHDIVCSLLIQHGALVDRVNDNNNTPLHYAAWKGHDKVCSLLIQHGALVDRVDGYNRTPLYYAAKGGHDKVCPLLVQHGADLRMMTNHNKTTLFASVNCRNGFPYRRSARMVLEWVRLQPGGDALTGQQLIDACQTELDLPIHQLSSLHRERVMEWVGMFECSKMNMCSGMFQAGPLPFQEMVVAWLTTVSAEWEREVDGASVRVGAWVGELPVEVVERVVATMASKYITTMADEE